MTSRPASSRLPATKSGCTLTLVNDAATGSFDPTRITQVFINLISNAIKYGPGQPIQVRLQTNAEEVVFSVQDGGPGVPPEMRTRIFERFERANRDRNVEGLGLGLYIAHQITLAHHGRIWVEEAAGKGALFKVALPLDQS